MQFFVQIGLKMEAGGCPPLNINSMRAISVKSYLNLIEARRKVLNAEVT